MRITEHRPADIKAEARRLVGAGHKQVDVAALLGIAPATLWTWIHAKPKAPPHQIPVRLVAEPSVAGPRLALRRGYQLVAVLAVCRGGRWDMSAAPGHERSLTAILPTVLAKAQAPKRFNLESLAAIISEL